MCTERNEGHVSIEFRDELVCTEKRLGQMCPLGTERPMYAE